MFTFNCRHAQLLEHDRFLLVISDRHSGNILIFLERTSAMDGAIKSRKHRKLLHRDKIGQEFLLAFDEVKRMLAVCASKKVWAVAIHFSYTLMSPRNLSCSCTFLSLTKHSLLSKPWEAL